MNQLNVERRGKVQALLGLEVETENEILKNTPPAEEAIRQIPRLFALIIGINVYQMNHRTLRGAVPDGKAFKRYLMERLCVPENQIITLFDRDATRTAIIENGFRKLRDNEDIKEGDPIFIFYAGHGSQKYAHPDWELNGRNVQMEVILPYDCGVVNEEHPEGVEPIPDRTIGILIDEIAEEKGDNITVVFDTCHSASGTRSQDENSLTIVRSVQLEDVPFRKETDRAIWARSARLDAAQSRRGLESHMLISACKSSEDAIEYKGRGKFSTALLKLLESTSPDKLRYRDILANMESISPQNPQCEGLSQDRLLFNGKVLPPGQVYPIREDTSEFALEASAAHAIALNAEYMPYSDPDKSLKPLPSPRPMFMQGTVEQTPSHVIKEAEFWSMIPSPLRPLKRRREFNEEERRNVRRVAPHHPNYEAQRSRNAEFSSLPPKRSLSPQYYWVPPLTPSPHSTPYYPPPPIEGYQFRHFSPTPEILNCDDINGGPRAQHYEHRRPALPSQRPGYPSSQYRRTQSQSHARPPSPPPSALYRRVSLKPRPSAQHRRVLSQPRSERPPLHLQVVMGASEPGDGYEVHLHGQGRKERAANGGGGEDIVRNDERDASDAAASEDDDDDESIDSSADPEFEPDTFAAW
ncbi:hypothetical protein M413DRAFT_138461 [Hebeloma cylindrosporum]|uniref:Peptidase C14 caspase domain-containing protein n=1 Tax=Hebeloma cylindrosporum TaxID=76867 RepID=A0A0C3CDX4_HEBCY|nr:hypothetical protein M413DRAFT_138461 [Hebeloma cylindrosporum h7]